MRLLIPLVLGAALFGVARSSSDSDDPLAGGLSDAMRDPAVMEQARRSILRHRTQEPPRRACHRTLTGMMCAVDSATQAMKMMQNPLVMDQMRVMMQDPQARCGHHHVALRSLSS